MKALLLSLLLPALAHAALVEKAVEYDHDGTTLEGFHAYDDAISGQRRGILIIHQWTGLTEYEKGRARQLAEMGYNVFAADIYGRGIRPEPPEAGQYAGKYKGDRELYRGRLMAGLEVLKSDERTDPSKIAAIGYCFGGTGVLELARAGADIAGVVSFHGGLGSADGMKADKDSLKAKVLVCHGADDPFEPKEEIEAFRQEMRDVHADWQFISYGNAVHAFTQKMAGDDNSKGAAYNADADRRSWQHMQDFFAELFR
jgi:dienelactone hydrolase